MLTELSLVLPSPQKDAYVFLCERFVNSCNAIIISNEITRLICVRLVNTAYTTFTYRILQKMINDMSRANNDILKLEDKGFI